MTIASVGSAGQLQYSSAGGTSAGFAPAATLEVGNLIVLNIALDNTGTGDADYSEVTSVTDTGGNTWHKLAEWTNGNGAAGAGVTVSMWYTIVTTQLTTGSTITINFANSITDAAAQAWEFTIGTSAVAIAGTVQTLSDDAGEAGSMTISGLSSAETLFLRGIASESETTGNTATAGYTRFTATAGTISSTGGTDTTNVGVRTEFRIATATGDTSDPTTISPYDHASIYLALRESAGGGDVNLVIQDSAHGHSTDGIALTQQHVLVVADSTHGHSTDGIALTQQHVLVVADSTHGHSTDGIALTQQHVLVVADSTHGHSTDGIALTQQHVLVVADSAHGHSAESVVLETGASLTIADAAHAHTVDGLVLTQQHVLAIAGALHGHTADSLLLSITGEDAFGYVTVSYAGTVACSVNGAALVVAAVTASPVCGVRIQTEVLH